MWSYDKLLEFPVNIKRPNAKAAQVILSQYGGPDGELGASLRYLSQKFAMPNRRVAGLLNDIGTEELAHLEMIGAIVHQLTRNLSIEEIKKSGFDVYFVDHTLLRRHLPVHRRPHHRPHRGHGRRAEGPHHLR